MKHPMQPVEMQDGVIRFKRNQIIDWLFRNNKIDLNTIAVMDFPREDRVQLAQLIGYSVCGFHELNYVSDEDAKAASALAKAINPNAGGCRDTHCEIHSGMGVEDD